MTGVRHHSVLLALAVLLLLVGCASSTPPVTGTQQYTLLPALKTSRTSDQPTLVNVNDPVLRVAEIRAPAWLSSTRMYYRLDYRTEAELAAYRWSEWIAPPPVLLAEVLQGALAEMSRWKAVIGPVASADADVTLRLTLNGFQQVFTSRTRSVGVVDVTVTLMRETLIAQRRYHIPIPAPAPNARGGVKALSRASRKLAGRIQNWLASVLAENGS